MTNLMLLRHRQATSWSLILVLVIASLILFSVACNKKARLGGQVHGFVIAQFGNVTGATSTTQIYLPGVSVYLKNTLDGKHSRTVKTDARGFFITGNVRPGGYNVCAEAPGFVAACDSEVISVVEGVATLNHYFPLSPQGSAIQGRVA